MPVAVMLDRLPVVITVPELLGRVQVTLPVRSALVMVPVKRPTPPAVTAMAIRSSVAVAVSKVPVRMVAPPCKLTAVLVELPRPVTVAKVSDSLDRPQEPHWIVVVVEVRHWPFVPRARRVALVPSW